MQGGWSKQEGFGWKREFLLEDCVVCNVSFGDVLAWQTKSKGLRGATHPKTGVEPENHPFEKEFHLPNFHP